MTLLRRAVPLLVLPLSLIACGLASSPWLRAFPSSVLAVPLFGTALLSVLLPVVVIGIGVRKLWLTALIDVVGFVFFVMLVGLQELGGFGDLYDGLVHGPSQILTFALPLVSPRTLLVAPLALCWVSGAVIGECIGRGWQSVVPYLTLLTTFGLAYAGSARAITSSGDGRRYDTLLAGALLLTLLLVRAAQAWIEQDADAESTQPEGVLPLRGLVVGTVVSVIIALGAGAIVQTSAFSGPPVQPSRVPPLDQTTPLTPVAFIAGLRPVKGQSVENLFRVSVDQPTSRYLPIADLDLYDGDGWSFDRTFSPSGGIVPADADPDLRSPGAPVTQQYSIQNGSMVRSPWMPFLYRPQRVTGVTVNIDPASGMIVPGRPLVAGLRYAVRSTASSKTFDQLSNSAFIAGSAPPLDTAVPVSAGSTMSTLITSLSREVGVDPGSRVAFLQAVARDLRTKYRVNGDPSAGATPSSSTPTPRASTSTKPSGTTAKPRTSPTSTSPATSGTATQEAPPGATGFATVLAAIRQNLVASPEQYATFMALVARQIGVPARVVTGFRVSSGTGAPGDAASSATMSAGQHEVTTADAYSWIEIPVQGRGWVVLDPTPSASGNKPQPSTGAQSATSPPPTPSSTPSALVSGANDGPPPAPKSTIPNPGSTSAISVVVVVLLAVAALVLLIGLFLVLRKRLRVRRRRRAGDPRRRLLGAWQESLDQLAESGLPDLTYLTSAEVARTIHEQFGGEPAAQAQYLGDSANAAIFSPTSWVGPQQADAAWRAQSVLRKSIRSRLSVRERMNASLRYHRTTRPRPIIGPSSWAAAARARATTPAPRGRHSTRERARRRRTH